MVFTHIRLYYIQSLWDESLETFKNTLGIFIIFIGSWDYFYAHYFGNTRQSKMTNNPVMY